MPALQIGPVPGFTSSWHEAPSETGVPLGAALMFRQPVAIGAEVTWIGAEEVYRDDAASVAQCHVKETGDHLVTVVVVDGLGAVVDKELGWEHTCRLTVLDWAGYEVSVELASLGVESINPQVAGDAAGGMSYFFMSSIAGLWSASDHWYVTSVDREVLVSMEVIPPEFSPLIEWRVDQAVLAGLGGSGALSFDGTGAHFVSVGPVDNPLEIVIETYDVAIVLEDPVEMQGGVRYSFEAITDPRGLEACVTWLASTKYGVATPVLGHGARFSVEFQDPSGPGGQWLGVRADNVAISQDAGGANCLPTTTAVPANGQCPEGKTKVLLGAVCDAGGKFQSKCLECFSSTCDVCVATVKQTMTGGCTFRVASCPCND